MSINFIPNDPRAGSSAPSIRVQSKRANRLSTRSGFTFSNVSPEGVAAPGTPQFLFWQCREAAIAAVEAWEASAGPHKRWQGNRKKLALLQDVGVDLNAFYDQQSFSFFHQTLGTDTFFSGASTDVVAHEIGHGLLDSIRPDFFSVNFLEVGAFHEAFGDCLAILTALADKDSRVKLLAVTANLRKQNFVETTAEDLSAGIKKLIPNHNAAAPRRAFNTFQFQLPSTLPSNGGPGALINEEHSFGMVFTGCFWDLLANLFDAQATKTEATLAASAVTAGKILIAGTKNAVVTPRFLQSVGRAMVLADQSLHAGANRDHIRTAFSAHGILLGTNTAIAPTSALAGPAPMGANVDAATRRDVLSRLGLSKVADVTLSALDMFGTPLVNMLSAHEVSLGALHKKLKGVVCLSHDVVTVGSSGARAAVVGVMPNTIDSENEVQSFVTALLEHGRIDFGGSPKKGVVASSSSNATHAVKTVASKKMLVRTSFQCGAH